MPPKPARLLPFKIVFGLLIAPALVYRLSGGTNLRILLMLLGVMLAGLVGKFFVTLSEHLEKKKQGKTASTVIAAPKVAVPLPPGVTEVGKVGETNSWDNAADSPPASFDLAAPAQPYRVFSYQNTRITAIACEWYALRYFPNAASALFSLPTLVSVFFCSDFLSAMLLRPR